MTENESRIRLALLARRYSLALALIALLFAVFVAAMTMDSTSATLVSAGVAIVCLVIALWAQSELTAKPFPLVPHRSQES